MLFEFAYGRTGLAIELPREKIQGEYRPRAPRPTPAPSASIGHALRHPCAGPRLDQIAGPECSVAITIEDITRPVPTHQLLPPLFEILHDSGVRDRDITIIVATGLHRPMESEEIRRVAGDLPSGVRVVNHDAHNPDELRRVGATSRNTELYLNRHFAGADVRIVTGDVEYHQIAGYGGGGKSVLPGLCDAEAVRRTHARLGQENVSAGILDGNPVRAEIDEAARMAGVDFSVNLVLDSRGRLIRAFCGDVVEAFRRAAGVVDEVYGISVPRRYQMVIADAGGYPRDMNLYQSQKAVENAGRMVQPGGRLVLIAECSRGWGSELFREWAAQVPDLDHVKRKTREHFEMGRHKLYQFALARETADLYLISRLSHPDLEKFIEPITADQLAGMVQDVDGAAILHDAHETVPRVE